MKTTITYFIADTFVGKDTFGRRLTDEEIADAITEARCDFAPQAITVTVEIE